jgi:signal transduction histidine kinase
MMKPPGPGAAAVRTNLFGDRMIASVNRLHRWIFLLTAGFLFTAAVLRSVLSFAGEALLMASLLLLLAWALLFALEAAVTPRRPSLFPLYLLAQAVILVVLLASTGDSGDFYAVLFGVLSMQAMQRLGWRTALLWIALFTPLIGLTLTLTYDVAQAVAFAANYTAVNVILAFFTLTTRRADQARARDLGLQRELAAANAEIEAYSRRLERLGASEERHRLARELHDSVTQTIFGMNLTAQSATLLLPRDPSAAAKQLDHVEELGRSALAEIGALKAELTVAELERAGLAAMLRRHVAERGLPSGLTVDVSVEGGSDDLPAAEELSLFRIAQEALNNVVKHAGAGHATVRLNLAPPRRLEVEDDGRGFAIDGERGDGMGLDSMRERATGIGWSFAVASAPGEGTRVVVEQPADEGTQTAAGTIAEAATATRSYGRAR